MGIRVHKVLGYGIADLKTKDGKINDPRINAEAFGNLHNEGYELSGSSLLEWVQKEKDKLLKFHLKVSPYIVQEKMLDLGFRMLEGQLKRDATKRLDNISGHMIHASEYGIPEVLLFRPLCCDHWSRYDDVIDYYEEEKGNRFRFLETVGIYPWIGPMLRFRPAPKGVWTTQEAEDKALTLEGGHYNQLVGRWDPKQKPIAEGRFLKHLLEDYRPATPLELHAVLWYFRKAFKDLEGLLNSLRPMIYVYWS